MQLSSGEDPLIVPDKPEYIRSWRLVAQVTGPILGGFLFGYDTGIISGAMLLLRTQFKMSYVTQEIVVSATIAAAAIGSLLVGPVANRLGRKIPMVFGSVTFLIGALLLAVAPDVSSLIVGRSFLGIGVGVSATCSPIYLAEIAPENYRGRIILLYNLSIIFGQLIATVIAATFQYMSSLISWRLMLGVSMIPAAIQMVVFILLPESFRWLIGQKRLKEARRIVISDGRHNFESVDDYIQDLVDQNDNLQEKMRMSAASGGAAESGWIPGRVIRDRGARRALLIGCAVMVLQQAVGINTVMYYTGTILHMAGWTSLGAVLWLSVVVVACSFLSGCVGLALIDRIGRRRCALYSMAGVCIGLAIMASAFQYMAATSLAVTYRDDAVKSPLDLKCAALTSCEACITMRQCGFCYSGSTTQYGSGKFNASCLPIAEKYDTNSLIGACSSNASSLPVFNPSKLLADYCPHRLAWLIVLGMGLYLISFLLGMGPVPWTITSEIYPLWCREHCMAISTAINWMTNLIVSLTFLSLTEAITKYGTFWLYMGIGVSGMFFLYFFLPETNQKTLEEITESIEDSS